MHAFSYLPPVSQISNTAALLEDRVGHVTWLYARIFPTWMFFNREWSFFDVMIVIFMAGVTSSAAKPQRCQDQKKQENEMPQLVFSHPS
jgi:hypothetical protein